MKSKQLYLILGAALVITAIAAAALIATRPAETPAAVAAAFDPGSGVISPAAYVSEFANGGRDHVLIDVRTPGEFAGGHIANAINISVETLAGQLAQIPTDRPVIVYCRSGNRSSQAANILRRAGYTQVYDLGGIIRWQAEGYSLVQ
jgi:rhodanese-related sulfurtransferase